MQASSGVYQSEARLRPPVNRLQNRFNGGFYIIPTDGLID